MMAYSRDFKIAVVEYARRNSILSAANYFNLSRNTVRKWLYEKYPPWQPPDDGKEYVTFEIS